MFDKSDRGLLDLLATIVVVVAVYTGTPLGGLVDQVLHKAFGIGSAPRPLISYFNLVGKDVKAFKPGAELADTPLADPRPQDKSLASLHLDRVPTPLARAFAAVASGGVVTQDDSGTLWYDLRPLPHHDADRAALGLTADPDVAKEAFAQGLRARLADALEIFVAARARLGGDDAGLAAYAVSVPVAARAVRNATRAGAAHPATLEAFEPYLAHGDAVRARIFVSAVRDLETAYEMDWPVDGRYPVTSGFGMRIHPILGYRKMHDGVDLGAPEGAPIHAAASGVVAYAGADGVNGLYVKLDHGYGLDTAYCHASRIRVHTGEQVKEGEVLGWVGDSGRTTGPHLHYGVFVGGHAVDPLVFRPAHLMLAYKPRDDAAEP